MQLQLVPVKVGVEESTVNTPRITNCDQLFKSNLTFALFAFLIKGASFEL
jgi:hypothetical protein